MLHKLRRRVEGEKGFTLIELLVVILIIGILAAIAIPSFLGQRTKGQDAKAKSDVRTAQTAMETYFTDNQTYATATVAKLQAVEPTLADASGLALAGLGVNTYKVTVDSDSGADGGGSFSITRNADGTTSRTCANADKGACKAGGKW
jgi:type IV pilus assembly protein PilA